MLDCLPFESKAFLFAVALALVACGGEIGTTPTPTLQSSEAAIVRDARTQIARVCPDLLCIAPGRCFCLAPAECMDTAGSFDVGNPIQLFSCQRFPDQQFRLDAVTFVDSSQQIVSCGGESCNATGVSSRSLCVGANPTGIDGRVRTMTPSR